ncbi:DUF4260 domain-containing protein [Devosia oryziradicis]|uniref:DUF4260 domain-containing protein n=1 Tax=Devosia oryziradicis TaxID=2801335 RepID=A0ABX7BY38_9HYPH|nr:DUF4260 domain-containing protein [Devosia oryziradicis]QQR36885.1 DUF4260 domain-containing protein [Devosia oryziradicis]
MGEFILWQRAEAVLVFLAGLLLFWQADSGLTWWLAAILFFAPDLGFAAYLAGNRIGAVIYNLVHLYAFGLGLFAIGIVLAMPVVAALGALWLAHAGFDRLFGYGLKSTRGFDITHLGMIGKHGTDPSA